MKSTPVFAQGIGSLKALIGGGITYKCLGGDSFKVSMEIYLDDLSGDALQIAIEATSPIAIYTRDVVPQYVGELANEAVEIQF